MAQLYLTPTVSWFAPERMGTSDYYHMARGYPLRGMATRYENCAPGNQLPGLRVVDGVRWHVISVPNLNRTRGQMVTNNFRPPSLTQLGTVTTEKQQLAVAPVIPIASMYI